MKALRRAERVSPPLTIGLDFKTRGPSGAERLFVCHYKVCTIYVPAHAKELLGMADIGDDQRLPGGIRKDMDHPQGSLRRLKGAARGQPQAPCDVLIDQNGPGIEEKGGEDFFPHIAVPGGANAGRNRPYLLVEKGIHSKKADLFASFEPQLPVDDRGKKSDRRIGQKPGKNLFLHRPGGAFDGVRCPTPEEIDGVPQALQGRTGSERHPYRCGHTDGDAEELEDAQALSPHEVA